MRRAASVLSLLALLVLGGCYPMPTSSGPKPSKPPKKTKVWTWKAKSSTTPIPRSEPTVAQMTHYSPKPDEAWLVEMIAQRLELAREVAWAKYGDRKPVSDAAREKAVLDAVVPMGVQAGLPEKTVRTFFSAQIAASRHVQEEFIHRWSHGGELPAIQPVGLERAIRPQIDLLNAQIIATLSRLAKKPPGPGFARYAEVSLRERGISRAAASLATAPLR